VTILIGVPASLETGENLKQKQSFSVLFDMDNKIIAA
jgi:hypothetical protein